MTDDSQSLRFQRRSSTASAAGSRSRRRPKRPSRSTSSPTSSPTAIATCRRRVERIAGHDGCGDHLVARSSWGQDAPGILVLSHLDTVHPMGFIERLPFKIEGDSAFGPGIYDMKGGAYLAYHAFRQICADGARSPLGITQLYVSDEEIGSPTSRALIESRGTQGEICAGDRARARRRQDRHRAQGRRALRGFHQGRAVACRHAARGRPQRHPRTRQCHPDAGGDERSRSAASPSMSAWSGAAPSRT